MEAGEIAFGRLVEACGDAAPALQPFSRRVVARETSAHADADLVLTTLEYALASREVEPGKLIHHAGHGCQYTSAKRTTRLPGAGVAASMGSVGDSYDKALRRTRG